MKHVIFAFALLVFSGAHAGAERATSVTAMQPQIKLGIGARPAVMFVHVHNKGAATRLIGASSDAFARIELHTHEMNGGMMRMVEVTDFAVPANGKLHLKPGGHHLMMFGYRGDGEQAVTVTLTFANGEELAVAATPSARAKPNHDKAHDKMHKKMHHHGH
ncbi:MAG: copper chaperone PCu(A)C [Alphaproteobacteria bacterium]|nr:copper chaperone PCu(A)C [Alphaproteobacteria bacterium]